MNQRLQQFLTAENINQAQFADTIEVARASVSHVLAGRNNPGYDFLKSIALHYPKLNLDWLMTGSGRMYKDQDMRESRLFGPANDSASENPVLPGLDFEEKKGEESVEERRISKIIVFYDNGSFREIK